MPQPPAPVVPPPSPAVSASAVPLLRAVDVEEAIWLANDTRAEQILTTQGSPMTSSLSRELMAGHHTEVEPVLGDLVARADATATPTPLLALATLALRIHNARLEAANGLDTAQHSASPGAAPESK